MRLKVAHVARTLALAALSTTQEAHVRASESSAKSPADKMISLVVHDGDAIFVRWVNARTRIARLISLDEHNRIKTIVAYAVPLVDLSSSKICIVDTGTTMIQTTAAGRPPMPSWCLAIQNRERVRLYCGPMENDSLKCILCAAMEMEGHVEPDPRPFRSDMYVCTECLSPWHQSCATFLKKDVCFETFVCPVCSEG